MGRCYLRLSGIDTDHGGPITASEPLTQISDGGNGGSRSQFHYHHWARLPAEKCLESPLLQVGPVAYPGIIAKHEDVRSGDGPAHDAPGNAAGAHGRHVYDYFLPVFPDGTGTWNDALQVMNGAVHLQDIFPRKTCLLELSVNIGRDHEAAKTKPVDPFADTVEPVVCHGLPVEVGPVAIESPRKGRVPLEAGRVRSVDEVDAEPLVKGVCPPETLGTPEIGQPGINPHPGAGCDYEGTGVKDGLGGTFKGHFCFHVLYLYQTSIIHLLPEIGCRQYCSTYLKECSFKNVDMQVGRMGKVIKLLFWSIWIYFLMTSPQSAELDCTISGHPRNRSE